MAGRQGDWFRPMWRRVLVTGGIAAWCLWEWLYTADAFWGVLTTALLAYAVYTFFIAFPREEDGEGDGDQPRD